MNFKTFFVIQIWLTKDDRLVIIHGGDDGEMPLQEGIIELKKHYIWEMTFDEIQKDFKKTMYFQNSSQGYDCLVPEVFKLFELVNDKVNFKNQFNKIQIVQDEINSDGDKFNRKILMNLEMKVPRNLKCKNKYRWRDAIK